MSDWVYRGLEIWDNMDFCHTCKKWVESVYSALDEDDFAPRALICPECNKVMFEAEVRARRRRDRAILIHFRSLCSGGEDAWRGRDG